MEEEAQTSPPVSPPASESAPAKRSSDRGWWIGGFLFGFAVGLALSLTYGWVLDPRPLPVRPADLRVSDKEFYLRLIAAAYAYDQDEARAQARLATLAEPDLRATLIRVTERYILDERDVRDVLALVALAEALGYTSNAMLAFLATSTPLPTATPTPAATPTPRPTQTPTPLTPVPTPTPIRTPTPTPTQPPTRTPRPTQTSTPTQTATPGPDAPFGVAQSVSLCDNTNGGLLRIYVRDRLGVGLSGVEIAVRGPAGQERFFSGLKPEIDPGYADFQMEPGETYQVELVGVERVDQPAEIRMGEENLCPDLPTNVEPSWQIVFQQGVSR